MQTKTDIDYYGSIKNTRHLFILFIAFVVVQNFLLYYNFFDLDKHNSFRGILFAGTHIFVLANIFSYHLKTRIFRLVIISFFCLASILFLSYVGYTNSDMNINYLFLSYVSSAILYNIFSHLSYKKRNKKLELITFSTITRVDINRYSIIFSVLFVINFITWILIIRK